MLRLLAFALLLLPLQASADKLWPKWDRITVIGVDWKLNTSSYIALPKCNTVETTTPWPLDPRGRPQPIVIDQTKQIQEAFGAYSCGGDNPMFHGYPFALERSWKNGLIRLRVGAPVFHTSQWFDGTGELHIDAFSGELTINWSQRKRNKSAKK